MLFCFIHFRRTNQSQRSKAGPREPEEPGAEALSHRRRQARERSGRGGRGEPPVLCEELWQSGGRHSPAQLNTQGEPLLQLQEQPDKQCEGQPDGVHGAGGWRDQRPGHQPLGQCQRQLQQAAPEQSCLWQSTGRQ